MRHGVRLSAHWAIAAVMAVAMVSLLLPAQASAQELWRGARAGDTPAQVQAKFPKATEIDYSPEERATLPTAPGRSELRLEDIDVAERNGKATFVFTDNRLISVIVSVETKDMSPGEAKDAFDDLAGLLSNKYGPPLSCGVLGGSGSKCRWLAGETYIGLNRYGIVDIVNVWYMAKPDSLDDNL
jgi:hypothetical protein